MDVTAVRLTKCIIFLLHDSYDFKLFDTIPLQFIKTSAYSISVFDYSLILDDARWSYLSSLAVASFSSFFNLHMNRIFKIIKSTKVTLSFISCPWRGNQVFHGHQVKVVLKTIFIGSIFQDYDDCTNCW